MTHVFYRLENDTYVSTEREAKSSGMKYSRRFYETPKEVIQLPLNFLIEEDRKGKTFSV